MSRLIINSLLLCVLCAFARACEYDNCKNVDYGSCGNACCKLGYNLASSVQDVMNKLNATICAGGHDGQYTAQMTAEGTLGFGDLRNKGLDVDYIGQVSG